MPTKNFNPTDLVATPQLSQVEVRFKAPLEKNSIVERVSDIVNITIINPKFSYPHKHIWVMETESFWYIEDRVDEQGKQFDGSKSFHWKEQNSRAQLRPHDSTASYKVGDCVYYKGKIYRCIKYIRAGSGTPIWDETYWEAIVGEIETYRYWFCKNNSQAFNNNPPVTREQPFVPIRTEIHNPIFTVMLGTLQRDAERNIVTDPETGFPLWENPDEVETVDCMSAQIVEPSTFAEFPDENSPLYHIYFQEKGADFAPDEEMGEAQFLEGVICVK